MDYDETEDVLFRAFNCCCGSTQCRGTIMEGYEEAAAKRRRRKVSVVVTATNCRPSLRHGHGRRQNRR
jgi:hypothetical protein